MPKLIASVLALSGLFLAGSNWLAGEPARAAAQQAQPTPAPPAQHPPIFFREDWKFAPGLPNVRTPEEPEHAIVQADVANPNLEVRLYGDKSGPLSVTQPANNNITYVMTLNCASNCAITLRDKNNDVDLTGLATIHWRTRINGFHLLHPLLKLADGTWLVGDQATGYSADWVESEFQLADLRWRTIDIENVVENNNGKWVEKPNLSRVEEIGFTDLMRGGGHGGVGSRIDWIQVTGKPVPRAAAATKSSSK
jgi:hypothetical protein